MHVGAQQPREPAHDLEQRPGHGRLRRDVLRPRRGDGRVLEPDAAPVREPGPYVVRHGRGLHAILALEPRDRARDPWFVPVGDPVRVARVKLTNTSRRRPAHLGDALRRMGPRILEEPRAASGRDLVRRRGAHPHGAQPPEHRLSREGLRSWPRPDLDSYTGSRTEFIGRNRSPATPQRWAASGSAARPGGSWTTAARS